MQMPFLDVHSGYSFITLYLLTLHVNNLTSRSSTHWKLLGNSEILPIGLMQEVPDDDPIISSNLSSMKSGFSSGTQNGNMSDFDIIMHILVNVERDPDKLHSWIAQAGKPKTSTPLSVSTNSNNINTNHEAKWISKDSLPSDSSSSSDTVPYVKATCINQDLINSPSPSSSSPPTNNNNLNTKSSPVSSTVPRIVPIDEANEARRKDSINSQKLTSSSSSQDSSSYSSPSSSSPSSSSKSSSLSSGKEQNNQNPHENNNFTSSPSYVNCLPAINFSQYDHLGGVSQRELLIRKSEPNLALLFRQQYPSIVMPGEPDKIDLAKLEEKLLQKKQRRPKSPQVYNQIGNLLRMYGDSTGAVECFRRALYLSPAHPDALLNLARVLLNHNYFSDALYLVRRSLEYQDSLKSPWANHYTIGEILKAAGHHQEAAFHFKKTLELNPDFLPAEKELHDLDMAPSLLTSLNKSINVYTIFIIASLVVIVLAVINNTMDNANDTSHAQENGLKSHRHFNRAMAMKALKQTMSHRGSRFKKGNLLGNNA